MKNIINLSLLIMIIISIVKSYVIINQEGVSNPINFYEALMKIELVKNGPLVVAFEVYDDFMTYRGKDLILIYVKVSKLIIVKNRRNLSSHIFERQ